MTDILQTVSSIASDIFHVPVAQIRPDSSPDDIESWDSTQHLNLVLAIEEKFAIQLSPEDMEQMRTIATIVSVVQKRIKAQ